MNKFFIALLILFFSFPAMSYAQAADSMSLTITPPFFELNVNPGDSWSSSIRVVNANGGALQVHAMAMGFAAADDFGHGSFIPLSQLAGDDDALANWITVSSSSINVSEDGATDIPFSVSIPPDASPGGHYAAILIGTGAQGNQSGGSQVGVSSFISALVFVRVSGNIIESGQISDFSTDKSSYQTPDVHFAVDVKNTGNVHIRPVGMIQIYNAFGKERGEIAINATGTLGYVLPSSSREFDAEWQGQPSLWDVGPYTAVLSLGYGENGTKNMTRTIEFWVLPIDQLLEMGFGIFIAAVVCIYLLRRAIKKMLANELARYGDAPRKKQRAPHVHRDDGALDLRNPYDR